jgi:hypothetical protein
MRLSKPNFMPSTFTGKVTQAIKSTEFYRTFVLGARLAAAPHLSGRMMRAKDPGTKKSTSNRSN